MKRPLSFLLFAVLALGFVAEIHAQEERPQSYAEMLDKANRAFQKKDWGEAARLNEKLLEENPKSLLRLMTLGRCYFELYQVAEAEGQPEKKEAFRKKGRDAYQAVLGEEPSNLLANANMARLLAFQARSEDGGVDETLMTEVKAHLLEASFNGYRALEALNFYPEFAPLTADTKFQVSLITKPKEYQYSAHGSDPFNNPLPRVEPEVKPGDPDIVIDKPTDIEELTESEQKRILTEIEEHINELERALKANEFEIVSVKWREIEALLSTKGGAVTEQGLRKELQKLQTRFSQQTKQLRNLELQHLFQQGRKLIQEMRERLERNELNEVRNTYQRLLKHAEMMKRKDPGFALPADELIAEGEPLDRKAELLLSINNLELRVTGIIEGRVLGVAVDRAIINEKIYQPGDKVFDVNGKLIKGLTVFAVSGSQKMVRFRFEDVEFNRKLGPPEGTQAAPEQTP